MKAGRGSGSDRVACSPAQRSNAASAVGKEGPSCYVLLGACNPNLAHQALGADSHIGLLLPCNVVVQEPEGGVTISITNPRAMFALVDNPDVAPVAEEANTRLRRVMDAVASTQGSSKTHPSFKEKQ